MYGCGPCNHFYWNVFLKRDASERKGSAAIPSSEFEGERLSTDVDLNKLVTFTLVEFGYKKDEKLGIVKEVSLGSTYPKLAPMINHAPYLWFHPAGDQLAGEEYKGVRTFDAMKTWILKKLKEFQSSGTDTKAKSESVRGKSERKEIKASSPAPVPPPKVETVVKPAEKKKPKFKPANA
jgi:hypothetical protein